MMAYWNTIYSSVTQLIVHKNPVESYVTVTVVLSYTTMIYGFTVLHSPTQLKYLLSTELMSYAAALCNIILSSRSRIILSNISKHVQ